MGITCSNHQNLIREIDRIDKQTILLKFFEVAVHLTTIISEDTTKEECECLFWNKKKAKWQCKKIQIAITKVNDDYEVKYILDGQILRIELQKVTFARPQVQPIYLKFIILNGFENIKRILKRQENGQLFGRENKSQKWVNIIINKLIKILYDNQGQKLVFGKKQQTIILQTQVYQIGQYLDNLKIGKWMYIFENEQIGGGRYNQQNQKEGLWIELNDKLLEYFLDQAKQLIKENIKMVKKLVYGIFNTGTIIMYLFIRCKISLIIIYKYLSGGGSYEYQIKGDSIKFRIWNVISDVFYDDSQIIFSGESTFQLNK